MTAATQRTPAPRGAAPAALAAAALLLPLAGCSADALGRHLAWEQWAAGVGAQFARPERVAIGAGLLAATATTAALDHQLIEEATENQAVTQGNTSHGDATAVGLTAAALGLGIADAARGDDAHALEVFGESFLWTED